MENVLPDVARIMAVSELVRLGVSLLIEILRSNVGTLPYYHFPRRVLLFTLPTPFFAPFVLISRYPHTISHIFHTSGGRYFRGTPVRKLGNVEIGAKMATRATLVVL